MSMNVVPSFASDKANASRSARRKKSATPNKNRAAKPQESEPMASDAAEQPQAHACKTVSVALLKPHPKQERYFNPASDEEIRNLAKSIDEYGLRTPIVALSDHTIVCGHRRTAALKLLGRMVAEVIVRSDLDNDPEACERLLVNDNLQRRQLSPLQRARCVQMLAEMHGEKTPGELMTLVAAELGVSDKTVRRLLNVLRLPREFQTLFDKGILKHRQIAKLLGMNEADRAKWAEKSAKATDPEKILSELSGCKNRKSICRLLSESDVWRQLARTIALIETYLKDAPERLAPDQCAVVTKCQDQLRKLLTAPKAKPK